MSADLLAQANQLFTTGHPTEALVRYRAVIYSAQSTEFQKAAALLGRSTASEQLASKSALPYKDPTCRGFALEAHRWLNRHREVPGLAANARMMFEARVVQNLMLVGDTTQAIRNGNEALEVADPRYSDVNILQQLRGILAQCYERGGDLKEAVKMYKSAISVAPSGPETPLIQQSLWELEGGDERVKPSDWESLIAKFPNNPYIQGVYGNYCHYLLDRGDFAKLASLALEYHRKFDKETPLGSFDTCSVDWNLTVAYNHAKRLSIAYKKAADLESRCATNPVGQLATQYLALNKPPAERRTGTFLPMATVMVTAGVIYLTSTFRKVKLSI